jgi:hypothetical protein
MKKTIALCVMILFVLSVTCAFAQAPAAKAPTAPAAKTTPAKKAEAKPEAKPAAKPVAKPAVKPMEIEVVDVKMGKDKKVESFTGKVDGKTATIMVTPATKMEGITALKKGDKVMVETEKKGEKVTATKISAAKKATTKPAAPKAPTAPKAPETKPTTKK